jgi:hypothetical protein
VSEDKAKAEADRQRELETKRAQAVDKPLHKADKAAQKLTRTPEKEFITAK